MTCLELLHGSKGFEYTPLEHAYDIRLFTLRHGRKSDILRGELSHVSLNDNPVYHALSYLWGDPTPVDSVYIARRKLPVAANLAAALRNMRTKRKDIVVWIDALCIDQSDSLERSNQVQMMKSIYQGASLVRVWINEDVEPSSPACMKLGAFDEEVPYASTFVSDGIEFWTPIVPIFQNQYWSRVWVQQEILNASKLVVYCPRMTIRYEALVKFQDVTAEALWDCQAGNGLIADSDRWIAFLETFVSTFPSGRINHSKVWSRSVEQTMLYEQGNLLTLLARAGGMSVTDERDRVYALMQLANDYWGGAIGVDYTLAVEAVFVSALRYHVHRHHTLDFLAYVKLEQDPTRAHSPSWLPKWSQRCSSPLSTPYWHESRQFRCLERPLSRDGTELRVQGMCVDYLGYAKKAPVENLGSVFDDKYVAEAAWVSLRCGVPEMDVVCERGADALPKAVCEVFGTHTADPYYAQERKYIFHALDRIRKLALREKHGDVDHRNREPAFLSTVDGPQLRACLSVRQTFEKGYFWPTRRLRLALLAAHIAGEGDEVWLILGCHVPVILRPAAFHGMYSVLGSADIPGFMKGEALAHLREPVRDGDWCGEYQIRRIDLV
ncbi:Folylpolyglutamate synthetase [Elasticomyces elasticus]|uniref:Folylpolyglutamate synthetase n=1 Tax=Elasticomyces elasticus TaxID=574655 RepID=A0AAN7ZQH4_9PEZI|nr:Folylpolyglutamate synthetase [Elasticomyces elasticus]